MKSLKANYNSFGNFISSGVIEALILKCVNLENFLQKSRNNK